MIQDKEKLLKFSNKLPFMNMEKVEKFKLKHLCHSRIYLSSLIVIANTLNKPFHNSIK